MRKIIILLLMVLYSCGTFKGHHSIVSVDSSPRGVKVFSEKKTYLGTTPFFYKITPERKQEFSFQNNEVFKNKEYRCDLNWSQSIIPGGILLFFPPAATIIGGVSLVTDFVTGGMYKCKNSLNIKFDSIKNNVERPRIILFLPPNTLDASLSDKLFLKWKKIIFSKLKKENDTIVDYFVSKKELSFIGIDHSHISDINRIRSLLINKIGNKYQITHLIQFKTVEDKEKLVITPKMYDIFTFEEVKNDPILKSISSNVPKYFKNKYFKWLLSAFSILPNTFQMGITDQAETKIESSIFEDANIAPLETSRHPDAFPRLITVFSLGVSDHPQFFKTWDYNFGFYPSFSGSSWLTKLSKLNDSYEIKLFNFYAFYNAGLTLHTAFGAIGLDVGVGAIYFTGSDNKQNTFNHVESAGRLNTHYVAYLSNRFYFRTDLTQYNLFQRKISNSYYKLISFQELFFGFGYYFPTFKNLIRKLMPF